MRAPDFALPDQNEEVVRLSEVLRDKHVVLYFYPKDHTPGCTAEAEGFRDLYPEFQKLGVEILGVSTDSVRSHRRFAEKLGLPFRILSDSAKEVVRKYGVYGEKKRFGKVSWGTHRVTYVIGRDGLIKQVFSKVNAKTHPEEVLAWVRAHLSGSENAER